MSLAFVVTETICIVRAMTPQIALAVSAELHSGQAGSSASSKPRILSRIPGYVDSIFATSFAFFLSISPTFP